ncbi:glycosyltransferase, partial [Candidatus Woesearchaeota archaeon]|nr:glycosyltransferase [Candidatus Woesearchaeota archaeon]
IYNFTTRLAKRGHKIILFVPKYPDYEDKKQRNIIIHRYFAVNLTSNKASKFAFPNILDILKKTKQFQPDVIHIQDPFNLGWVGTLASKIYGIPNIQTYHTYLPDFMVYLRPSKLTGLDKLAIRIKESNLVKKIRVGEFLNRVKIELKEIKVFRDTRKILRKSLPEFPDIAKGICWGYTRGIYNSADLVITPTKVMKRILRKHGIRPKIEVVSNGVEISMIPPKREYKLKKLIVHAGRLGHEKRIDVVIKAMSHVVQKDPGFKLHIYGPGPAYDKLKALRDKLGLEKNVIFKGALPRNKLLKVYRNYDLFVTASPMETQGLVVLEAMAAGLPVVGIRKLAVPEMVRHGVGGYIAQPYNHKQIAEYILKILQNKKRWERMGRAAREIASEHDIDKMALKLENVYMRVSKKI